MCGAVLLVSGSGLIVSSMIEGELPSEELVVVLGGFGCYFMGEGPGLKPRSGSNRKFLLVSGAVLLVCGGVLIVISFIER